MAEYYHNRLTKARKELAELVSLQRELKGCAPRARRVIVVCEES